MDPRRFLAEFAHIASAPGGIQRLRELVLQLAVSGGLTRPNSADENVEFTLATAERLKASYGDKLQLRITGSSSLRDTEYPYAIPDHWRWRRLDDIACYIQRGKSPVYAASGSTFVVSQKCIQWRGFDLSVARFVAESSLKGYGEERFLRPGDLLWNSTGTGTVGRVVIYAENTATKAVCDSHVTVIRLSNFLPRYIWCVIASPWVQARIDPNHRRAIVSGTTNQVELSTGSVRQLPVPSPPLSEQRRIVAKVDELMALCEKLEGQQQRREKLCSVTRTTAFHALGAAKTAGELTVAWRRIASEAPMLLDSPESVQSYRGAILDLAMRGALLHPSDYSSFSGGDLLREIDRLRLAWSRGAEGQELKEALAMQSKVRTQRRVQVDLPIPRHWVWGSILQVSQAVVDCHNKTAPYLRHGIHLVRTTDIRNGRIDLMHTRKISADTYAFWARRLPPQAGDVIFTREAPMGEAAIVPLEERVCLGQRTMLIRLFSDLFNNKFLLYAIYSPSFQARMVETAIGMTVKHLRVGDVEDLLVPVPPKEEQDRIVAVLDRLLAECDRLEENIARRLQLASDLARAVTEEITGIQTGGQDTMKTPKTELISPLRVGSILGTNGDAPLAAILGRNKGELSAKALWSSSGLDIDAFYQQLRKEMSRGWIVQPEPAYMKEIEVS
ncbi:MAG: type restriction enzyme subunit [Acidobacteriota bacterium]|jgi:type I restriction enzyme S subunit|nr:type restriction enzyme subunit [Acidobacteriota bacterium]